MLPSQTQLAAFATDVQHYYVDPFSGSDGAEGSRASPFASIHRAQATIRWARAQEDIPTLQVWLRADPTLQLWRALQI